VAFPDGQFGAAITRFADHAHEPFASTSADDNHNAT
jgi:hypothetical protein